jgi:hypothetical protein
MTVVALDPTGSAAKTAPERRLAVRPASLAGAVLGLVCNGLGRGEVLLDALAERLRESDGLAGVVKVVKSSVSVPPDPDDWSRLTDGVAIAITGFGG